MKPHSFEIKQNFKSVYLHISSFKRGTNLSLELYLECFAFKSYFSLYLFLLWSRVMKTKEYEFCTH